ncbi:MAG: response regulator, partial [Bacteroidales bacterium]|nr:response regulator [Bacteroidales bacterium]
DVIDISKIEAGLMNVYETECPLNDLLQEVHSYFILKRTQLKKENIEIKLIKGLEDSQSTIITDATRFRQIIINLVGNALKFTEEGKVEFGYTLTSNKTLQFYVKDTGIGIPTKHLGIIFERFRQSDYSVNRKYGGTGLGLSISKGFIELLGGKIWVKSTEGKGSIFYFTLPFKPTQSINFHIEPKVRHIFNWQEKCILIAEDNDTSYKFLVEMLKHTKVKLIRADNGLEAINYVRTNHKIDLILMDIQLPEMSGYDATRNIKESNPDIPVIAVTANAMIEEKNKCFEAGCDDYVPKPVDIKQLFETIDKLFIKQSVKNNLPKN